ncbi:MAG TPA: HD domain-containing protein [Acetobacteraceae bacterium]
MAEDIAANLATLLEGKGQRRYGLSGVNQLQHALQAAWLAENAGCAPSLIAAALLHDIGHMVHGLGEDPAADGVDDRHESLGHAYLTRFFGPAVTEPVRLHVAAKRYLCGTEPDYFGRLAPDSVRSLALQGGPMSPDEAAAFDALPYSQDAVRLRRFDEGAKAKGLETPPAAHFAAYLRVASAPGDAGR